MSRTVRWLTPGYEVAGTSRSRATALHGHLRRQGTGVTQRFCASRGGHIGLSSCQLPAASAYMAFHAEVATRPHRGACEPAVGRCARCDGSGTTARPLREGRAYRLWVGVQTGCSRPSSAGDLLARPMAWRAGLNAGGILHTRIVQIALIACRHALLRAHGLEKKVEDASSACPLVPVLNKLGIIPVAIFVITYPISQVSSC